MSGELDPDIEGRCHSCGAVIDVGADDTSVVCRECWKIIAGLKAAKAKDWDEAAYITRLAMEQWTETMVNQKPEYLCMEKEYKDLLTAWNKFAVAYWG